MQLSSIFRSLLAAYACGASGNYDRASQDYSACLGAVGNR